LRKLTGRQKVAFCVTIGLALVLLACVWLNSSPKCGLSDEEAITVAKEFYRRNNISYKDEPKIGEVVPPLSRLTLFLKGRCLNNTKTVEFFPPQQGIGDFVVVTCDEKKVTRYYNIPLRRKREVAYKHGLLAPRPENEIRLVVEETLRRLQVPSDYHVETLSLERATGLWKASLVRKKNGYSFENSGAELQIVGATNELVGFSIAADCGADAETEMKINQTQAQEIAHKKLRERVGEKVWREISDWYDIRPTELMIVQPNVFWGFRTFYYSRNSKLAWVIRFQLTSPELKMSEFLNEKGEPKPRSELTPEQLERYLAMATARNKKLKSLGEPLWKLTVKVDAKNGEIIGEEPWYPKW